MATAAIEAKSVESRAEGARGAVAVGAAAATTVVLACALAGFAPLGFSIVAVFLFAGPHNWLEARYMLSRMPARWGPLTAYFTTGIAGVVLLTLAMAGLRWLAPLASWDEATWLLAYALWNSALLAWLTSLIVMRSRQNPRRHWPWVVPVALVLLAANWQWPLAWSLALVYLHPVLALWFLDREIGKLQPAWRSAYRWALCLVPAALGVLWWNLASAADLPGDDWLKQQIAQHAGAGILNGVSTHLLVSTHVFLEMLHYGVWVVAIPLVSFGTAPWNLGSVPLAKRSRAWRWAVGGALAAGAAIMLALWGGFLADYPLTRDIYFTVAMLHVLAEAPFLLRLL